MGLGFDCKGPVIPGIGIGEGPAIADGGIGMGTSSVSVFVFIEESVCATVAWNAIIVIMKPKIFFIVFNLSLVTLIYLMQYLILKHLPFPVRINRTMVFEFADQQVPLFFLQKYFLSLQFLEPAHKRLAEKDQGLNHFLMQ